MWGLSIHRQMILWPRVCHDEQGGLELQEVNPAQASQRSGNSLTLSCSYAVGPKVGTTYILGASRSPRVCWGPELELGICNCEWEDPLHHHPATSRAHICRQASLSTRLWRKSSQRPSGFLCNDVLPSYSRNQKLGP